MEDIATRALRMSEVAYQHGRKTAEIAILEAPLPWSRDYFAKLADDVIDWWIEPLSGFCENDEDATDLVCRIAASARQGFIERAVELMVSGVEGTEGGNAQ